MRVIKKVPASMAFSLLLAVAVGCGGANRAEVSGRVTLDGKAVEDGTISFLPLGEPPGPSAWGQITAGNYSIPALQGPAVGANLVKIHWPRKTGRKTRYDPNMDEFEEAVPNRYHRNSELKVNLKPGKNEANFQLLSK